MTLSEGKSVLAAVEAVLGGKEILDQPRALLVLRLCQFSMALAPDRTERYWQLLQPIQNKLPPELQGEFAELKATLEESLPSGAKGFAAEMLAEIQVDRKLPDTEETKRKLLDCEARLKKRMMPFGKGPIWTALVEAWIALDRGYSLKLLKNVSGGLQDSFISKMNKASPLAPDEWTTLVDSVGMGRVEQAATKILDDDKQTLRLPRPALAQVAARLRSTLEQFIKAGNAAEMANMVKRYARMLALHAGGDQAGSVPDLLEELHVYIAKASWLDEPWLTRFDLIGTIIGMGVGLKAAGLEVMTPEFVERLVSKTPAHMVNFVRAQCAGMTTAAGQAGPAYATLMSKVNQEPTAEAWFLVTLVKQGMGSEALALASKSPQAQSLLPRLRRAVLCSHPETAGVTVSPADMAGDPIGEFLAQGSVEQRAAYLKSVTQDGTRSVPGAMWAGVGTETEPEGLRGLWKTLTTRKKTSDEVLIEYLARNPLYSSYRRDTKKENQFGESLRVNGFGDYRYQDLDSALLAALVAWRRQEPAQVKSVLRAMWNSIRPDDQILMVDWLRNAIMTRSVSVFSADAEVLTADYLAWLKRELVDKGRQWQFGKQIVTLRYPGTAPLQFCVAAASTVGAVSPEGRDQILLAGLGKFEANPALVEAAAQLYGSDKEPLALKPPLQLKPNLVAGWQSGIVKSALMPILQALVAQSAGPA